MARTTFSGVFKLQLLPEREDATREVPRGTPVRAILDGATV
jgi:hypothetical protein